jgi:hypothetical protein
MWSSVPVIWQNCLYVDSVSVIWQNCLYLDKRASDLAELPVSGSLEESASDLAAEFSCDLAELPAVSVIWQNCWCQ